jgi:hypothetical protein
MIRSVMLVLSVVMLSGCSALKTSRFTDSATTVSAATTPVDEQHPPDASPPTDSLRTMGSQPLVLLDNLLREAAVTWMGTPYLFGGISTSGIDCSALIQTIFSSALNMTLPRTTEEQIRLGWRVRRNQLDVGDLVFFRPDGRGRHAGIVLSEREFLHASTSQGVMISHLDEPYWRQWYHTGRRVVDDRWSPLERLAESSGN